LFMELERNPGQWNGEDYIGIARNIRPDHLAVLPDVKGACSIADGAGLLRTNQATNNLSSESELSFDSVQTLLREVLLTKESEAWVYDVFDDYFIYELKGLFYKQVYKIDQGKVTFEGLPVGVERQVKYKEVTLSANKENENEIDSNLKGSKTMEKEKIVNALITNENTSWTEEHRAKLIALDEELLTNMYEDLNKLAKTPPTTPTTETTETKSVETPVANTQVVVPKEKEMTAKEYVDNAPPEIRDYLQDGLETMGRKRQELINTVLANKQNTFTEENLKKKDTRELQALATLAQPVVENATIIPMYLGQNGATGGVTVEPLPLPTMNFEKKIG